MSFDPTLVAGVIGVLAATALLTYLILLFNNYITLKNLVAKASANIDVLLKQRFDEVPNLVSTVKGYMKHEADVLESLTRQRSAILSAGMDRKAEHSNQMVEALKSVFAVAERYPDLKANKQFLQLQQRLSEIETQIAQRRGFLNESTTNYNTWIESFPHNLLASALGAKRKELFVYRGPERVGVNV